MSNQKWNNDFIQFARLLSEIIATQANLDWATLATSMDLEVKEVEELFNRANVVWNQAKATKIIEPVFYQGDKLKVINNLNNWGTQCESGVEVGEIVVMVDSSSDFRSMILIQRSNGKMYQLDKKRFELFARAYTPL